MKSHKLIFIFVLFFLAGCASKKVRPPVLDPAKPGETESSKTAPEVIDPEKDSEPQREERGEPAPKPVTLVLGGAGVASFATVGILKALKEEKIPVERIIVTGWPSIFAYGYGVLKSIHDLEWFALRLERSDFFSKGLFDFNKGFHDHKEIEARLKKAFGNKEIRDSRVPIHIQYTENRRLRVEEFTEGNWENAILRAISAPGLFQPYPPDTPHMGFLALNGLGVQRALDLGAENILAFTMYEDYVRFLSSRVDSSEALFRKVFAHHLKQTYQEELKKTPHSARIPTRKNPNDFNAKRKAIQTGYRAARRVLQGLN